MIERWLGVNAGCLIPMMLDFLPGQRRSATSLCKNHYDMPPQNNITGTHPCSNPSRPPVAISRARKRPFVIGSKYFFSAKICSEDQLADVNVFKRYYRALRSCAIDLTDAAQEWL